MPQQLQRIPDRYILVCEGQHDSQFFTHLVQTHAGLPQFTISSVDYVLGTTRGGNTKFTEALDELPAIPGFDQVERVLVVADNDLDPTTEFAKIVTQINATTAFKGPPAGKFIAPAAPQVKSAGSPPIVVLMLPWTNSIGNLDSICLRAAINNSINRGTPIAACVEEFARCAGTNMWPLPSLAKMKLRSLLSASWQFNPYISPSYVWSRRTDLVPLTDPVFNDIVDFLRGFPSL